MSGLIQLRAGARWRTLPFGTSTSSVSEKSYSLGAGTLLARGRAALDVAGIRATRGDDGGEPVGVGMDAQRRHHGAPLIG